MESATDKAHSQRSANDEHAATNKTAATTAVAGSACSTSASSSQTLTAASRSKRVLTVGDGNFSYSLAYAKRFVQQSSSAAAAGGVQLTATSYDSYEELVDKYPESARICAQIRECGAQVLHRVDATNLLVSLENALVESAENATSLVSELEPHNEPTAGAQSGGFPAASAGVKVSPFDVIIFNHPHCGEENVKRHKSLLSHFYASALEILCDQDESEIHLTLASGQPERWEAVKRARSAGLSLKLQVDDVDSHAVYGLEYERKRHQNGKSFHRVLLHGEKLQQQSTLFVFARRDSNVLESQRPAKIGSTGDSVPPPPLAAASSSRKRKAQDASLQQPLEFRCDACEKSFKTAQGLKTHVRMVHELAQDAAGAGAGAVVLPCGLCDRTFKNEDAQRQHRLAKHGNDRFIQPDWYQKQQSLQGGSESAPAAPVSAEQDQQRTCSVCHLAFPTQTGFDEHWQDLKPKEVVMRNCLHCGRVFDEERALRQHQNFCRVQAPPEAQ